jgi:hypothetical protein
VNRYLSGNTVRVATYSGPVNSPAGGFRDASGNLTDPGMVTLSWRTGQEQPVQSTTYPSSLIVKDGTGLYHADLDTSGATTIDTWTYEWSGAGGVQAAAVNSFAVTIPFP